jgi:hypothetical protein
VSTVVNRSIQNTRNKGHGAGGARTNLSGKCFEAATDIVPHLEKLGFERTKMDNKKFSFYMQKQYENKTVTFVSQHGFKAYCKKYFDSHVPRCPDEAFIIDEYGSASKVVKILEKKNQTCQGSVDTKLYCGPGFICEYEDCLGPGFSVEYALTLNDFFKDPHYDRMHRVIKKLNVPVFYGNEENYFDNILSWVGIPRE